MASIASTPPWNAEDDLLLKNAVEAGASLEALAKGTVRFSRKYSVRELQDRWHSLMYDADVSAQASARMTEYEIASPNVTFKASKFGVSKVGGRTTPVKRKGESIRRQYYDMRKKLCSFNTFDLSFIDEPNAHDDNMNIGNELLDGGYMDRVVEGYFEFSEGGQSVVDRGALSTGKGVITATDCLLLDNEKNDPCPSAVGLGNDNSKSNIVDQSLIRSGDGLVEFQNCSSSEVLGTSHVLQDMPLWKTMEDVSAPEMPIDVGLDDKSRNAEEALINHSDNVDHSHIDHSRLGLGEGLPGCEVNRSISLTGDDFADISDSLLNFTNENEHLVMDVDGENLNDKPCSVSDKPIQSSPPKDEHEIVAQKAVQPETSGSNTLHVVSDNKNITEKNDNPTILHSANGDQDVNPQVDTPSIKTLPDSCSPEFHCEMMECTLNTEDPEIPCNDEPGVTESSDVILPLTNQKNKEQESTNSKKEENLAAASMASQILGHGTIPKTNLSLPVVGCVVKPEPSDGNCLASIFQQANNVLNDGSQCQSAPSPKFSANRALKQKVMSVTLKGIKAPVTMTTENALISREPSARDAEHLEPEANSSPLYRDESEEELTRNADIPYFSDIENMILEMDLSPDDEESRFRKKVARYQHEDAKRKIMRLEQCARASSQRAIASKGALAVLYGRHLKQYVKKTEVVLGRATEDNEVDIDLGEEGHANKISRRQALIKLEGDGSFFLKNIGKSSIFLNGKEVSTGHRMCFSSSNLIEITGLSFVFEMNHKSITRYLAKASQNFQEKQAKLEWSPTKGNQ